MWYVLNKIAIFYIIQYSAKHWLGGSSTLSVVNEILKSGQHGIL